MVGKNETEQKEAAMENFLEHGMAKELRKFSGEQLLDNGAGEISSGMTRRQRQRQRQREKRRQQRSNSNSSSSEKRQQKIELNDIPALALRDDSSDDDSMADDCITDDSVDCDWNKIPNLVDRLDDDSDDEDRVCSDKRHRSDPALACSAVCNPVPPAGSLVTANGVIDSAHEKAQHDSTSSFTRHSDDKQASQWPGLDPPRVNSGERVSGKNKRQHRRENKAARMQRQEEQEEQSYWQHYKGEFVLPEQRDPPDAYRGDMCPSNLALHHPAAAKLLQYATGGCPSNTGQPWTRQQIEEAIERGPHVSAMEPEPMEQLRTEVLEKVKIGQARLVNWDDIKHDPPEQLKISPIAMIPHKSRKYRAILDLSFRLRLKCGDMLASVNEATTLEAPAGAIDQMGHALQRVIHAFAEASLDEKVFMAKFDIKDGFWRLQCQEGEEWNFAYVLPTPPGEPIQLVVPNSLQMGWVESPPNFCTASETARDVASQYIKTPLGSLPEHKFLDYAMSGEEVQKLPAKARKADFRYFLDVYVDDFIPMAIATSQEHILQVAKGVLMGIHDVFPADADDENDPISLKKLKSWRANLLCSKKYWALILMGS